MLTLLRERTKQYDDAGADKVASALGDLPLGLELAGAYCTQTDTTLAEYAEKMASGYGQVGTGIPLAMGRELAAVATFDLWFSKLERDFPAAMQLINLLAFFADSPIVFDLIVNHSDVLLEPLQSFVRDGRKKVVSLVP